MFELPEDEAERFYEIVWDAMTHADLARLEELSVLDSFPCGIDGWIEKHWLSTAINAGNARSVAWVLSKGPDVNYVDNEGYTALMSALQGENHPRGLSAAEATALTVEIVNLLLAAGFEINLPASLDETALHFAARWSSPTVVRHLLSRGADPFALDREHIRHTPLDYAKSRNRREVRAILLEAMKQGPKTLA